MPTENNRHTGAKALLKSFLTWFLTLLYRVEVKGLENYAEAGDRVLIVANHLSLLDPLLLGVFLPDKVTFAINTQIAKRWWVRPFTALSRVFPMDPSNALSSKALIKFLREDNKAIIFPEGRISKTGSLMKIYDGPGIIAEKAGAAILPVRVQGAQHTPFSRLGNKTRIRWFPKITLTILPAQHIRVPKGSTSEARRQYITRYMSDLMTNMIYETGDYQRTLLSRILEARREFGGKHLVMEDLDRQPVSYDNLITRTFVVGDKLRSLTAERETVGILLPNSTKTVTLLLALHSANRIPAMINFSAGHRNILNACHSAQISNILTSRRFIEAAELQSTIEQISGQVNVIYLDDLAGTITGTDKLRGLLKSFRTRFCYDSGAAAADEPAVILFTSGSEGTPKGVALSHRNLLSNMGQLAARVDFTDKDIILNSLPMFHSYGLTIGTFLPIIYGMKTFLYPSPLHYRIIPEVAYEINATIMFGTNTFLSGYAKYAHPYDFYSIRYVFAGAEKLHESTRQTWLNRFGVRIFEGYGATETSPVLAVNTMMENRPGTVGRMLPDIEYRLEPVPGVREGGRLHVRGPNIMQGYLFYDTPGEIRPPQSLYGEGWYDTGDIVDIDDQGYMKISGRAKRFAKIGGEMVSLASSEELANISWPEYAHAVVSLPDKKKGETLVLLTEYPQADRSQLVRQARQEGMADLVIPKKIIVTEAIPLMGTGKIDYPSVTDYVKQQVGA